MKKLFFVALIAGLFGAQSLAAQDTITARYFNQDGNRYVVAYAEDDNEQCIEAELEQVFTWNASTSVLSINGNAQRPFTAPADIRFWNGVFERSSLLVIQVNNNNFTIGSPISGVTFN